MLNKNFLLESLSFSILITTQWFLNNINMLLNLNLSSCLLHCKQYQSMLRNLLTAKFLRMWPYNCSRLSVNYIKQTPLDVCRNSQGSHLITPKILEMVSHNPAANDSCKLRLLIWRIIYMHLTKLFLINLQIYYLKQ